MALLWITIGIAVGIMVQWWLYQPHFMKGLHYRMSVDRTHVEEGGSLRVEQSFLNRTWLPFSQVRALLQLTDGLSDELVPFEKERKREFSHQTYLLWRQQAVWHKQLYTLRRGVHGLQIAEVRYWDAMTVQAHLLKTPPRKQVVVYPKCYDLSKVISPPINSLGDIFVRRWIMEDVFFPIGSREYQPGDNIRFVDWKATARTGTMQSRVFDYTSTEELYIILNLQREVHNEKDVDREAVIEECIRLTASVVRQAVSEGYGVGLYANGGCDGMAGHILALTPNASHGESELMECLARVYNYSAVHFHRYIGTIESDLPSSARVMVVTAYLDETINATLTHLQTRVSGLEVILGGDVDPRWTQGLHIHALDHGALDMAKQPTPKEAERSEAS